MRKRVVVNAMGKNITIDNPNDINIVFQDKGTQPFKFNIKIDKEYMRKLRASFLKFGERL